MEVPVAEPRDWLEDSTVVSGCQGTRGEKSRERREAGSSLGLAAKLRDRPEGLSNILYCLH